MSRSVAVLVWGALVLAALLGASVAAEAWRVRQADAPGQAARAQARAVDGVQDALADVFREMDRHAQRAAESPAVRRALVRSDTLTRGDTLADGAALAALAALDVPASTSVDVVSREGALVAWAGIAFPRSPGPPPDTVRSQAVRDDAGRRALALWAPVRDDAGRVVGAVRVVRLAQAAVPVRNRYLQDYDIADEWRPRVAVPFSATFGAARGPGEALRGPDGAVVGRVVVEPPSARALAAIARRSPRAWATFWATALLLWGVGGLVALTLAHVRAAEADNTRGRWVRAGAALAVTLGALAAVRYSLLALDVRVRWLDRAQRTAALFDPAVLALDAGDGLFRSPGDLALTAAVVLAGSGAILAFALRYAAAAAASGTRSAVRRVVGLLVVAGVAPAAALAASALARQAVLDATIGYADQTGPVLDGLLVVVLGSLAALLAAAIGLIAACIVAAWAGLDRPGPRGWAPPTAVGVAATAAAALALAARGLPVPAGPVVAVALLGGALAATLAGRPERWVWPLTFRGALVGALVLTPVLYGMMRPALGERTDAQLADAAQAFADGRDSRVAFAVDQVLAEARADDALRPALLAAVAAADSVRRVGPGPADSSRVVLNDLTAGLLTSSLLGSLADVAVEVRLVSPAGDTLGSHVEGSPGAAASPRGRADPLGYDAMRATFAGRTGESFIRRSEPVAGRRGLSRTAAIGPLLGPDGEPVAWVYLRTTPRPARFATETPFPRVLAPAGLFGLDDESLAYAEYDDGVLVRSRGDAALRLDSTVYARLSGSSRSLVRTERPAGGRRRVFYVGIGADAEDVVAVRGPANDRLDVLFVLLRLCLSALAAGALVYALGLGVRRRIGLIPAPRTRFRDKVLNRFLAVGLACVAVTGFIGQRVIEEQNRQAVRDGLRQRLGRAEAAFNADAGGSAGSPGAPAGPSAARLDAVAQALGQDVHLYRGATLEASSRRQLVRQRLIEPRLPAAVYAALFLDGEPYAFSEDRIGTFRYTTGYKALPDAAGRPAGALAVPTLSEQATIEVGQARMVAYLFGGLLLLLVAIVVLAILLAGQLTRPFGRLREGLQNVGAGGTEAPIPVETQDEVGELVESFNAMQSQLAESRRRLAAQERELAWSEMARQVAHEIKNPLMPMKLSVQHLQRVFRPAPEEAPPEEVRFAAQFGRTTDMLIDQIETLNRIASDFSAFARMPAQRPERLDVTEVAEEAAALFEGPLADAGRARLTVDLADEPLWVSADRDELRRVFVNLLTNALQAMPDRDRPGIITLRTRADAGQAVAEVADDGAGIAEDVQPRVFQPSFSTKSSGMGLGLAISKRAVEAAGGSIAFETADGEGTTFTVRLPLAGDEA
ncbi:MAG TPA: ATP-binding protein [Rubricoccaceae bacterium]